MPLIIIIVLSLFVSAYSMRDLHTPQQGSGTKHKKNVKGTIVIMKDSIKHYSSSSS